MLTPAARAAVVLVAFVAAPRRAAAEAPKPLPGTVGLVQKEDALRNACVPTFRVIKKVKRGDDAALVAALTYPRIGGLDFDPARPARQKASLKKFEQWYQGLDRRFRDARTVQEKLVTADGATGQAKVEGVARVVLLTEQAAMLVDAVEIPASVRKQPEAADVFCDMLHERAEPLRASAEEARVACRRMIGDASLPLGWWSEVCAMPLAGPPPGLTPKPKPAP
jgi:hypothetical protein